MNKKEILLYQIGNMSWVSQHMRFFKEKKSIIDYGLTNSKSIVKKNEILPIYLGASPQTCHKVIKLTLNIDMNKKIVSRSITQRRTFRLLTEQKHFQILNLNIYRNRFQL